jgi:uncharacterized membrane protein YqjE
VTTTYQRTDGISGQLRRGRDEVERLRDEVREINDDLRVLADKQAALAKTEVREQLSLSTRMLGLGAGALVFANLAAVFVSLTTMFALWVVTPMWVAALITTLLLVACAAFCGFVAYSMFKRLSFTPKRTLDSLREDVTWVKQQLNFSAK